MGPASVQTAGNDHRTGTAGMSVIYQICRRKFAFRACAFRLPLPPKVPVVQRNTNGFAG